ncbi:transmembrane protease serine 9-like [Phymastichus coffea]|uniref:transmembrane protease serine 9-like n=1 Tax=Phymastichus coffea TaxID=108790 RepID=UPI00273B60C5|nr:transmembrane protease serine 9-like [Phymastichus coffea]
MAGQFQLVRSLLLLLLLPLLRAALVVADGLPSAARAALPPAASRKLVLGAGGQDPGPNFYEWMPTSERPGSPAGGKAAKPCQRSCVCGLSQQTRIVNGQVSGASEFPWAAALDYHGAHHCGASLLTRRHLLTAAHCIHGFERQHLTARLADRRRHPLKSLVVHERYDRATYDNDIAIVELRRPIPLDGPVRTVCLPSTPSFGYAGATGVAVGWGRLGEGRPVSEQLRKVDLPIMSKQQCLQSDYPHDRVTDNMFCAGYLQGQRDTCSGDSGGALHVRNEEGAMEVIGLVSFGRGCARPNFPGVYTKISNYLEWIHRHLNDECLCPSPARLPARSMPRRARPPGRLLRAALVACLALLGPVRSSVAQSAFSGSRRVLRQPGRGPRIFFDDIFGIDVSFGSLTGGLADAPAGPDGDGAESGLASAAGQNPRNCSCECGLPNQEIRIVGGRPTEPNKYPWLARLVYDGKFHCGASLLSNDYVITAAHCLRKLKRSKIRIILGDHNQFETSDGQAVMRAVGAVVRHRNFDTESYNHDVALLKLRRPVVFSKTIRPVCLPQAGSEVAGKYGTVVGWGRTKEGGMLAGVVQEVSVPILSTEQCRRMKYRASRITENMLCAGNGSQDSCQGDSGGPLLVDEAGRLEIAGIVSWGVGCGRPGYPGVYTRVNRYLHWIRLNMKDACLCNG